MANDESAKAWGFKGAGWVLLLIAIAARLPHINQSLWCDEMSTYLDYVQDSWQKVLAANPGEYVPNNHVLLTILLKIVLTITGGFANRFPPAEALLRLPSLMAGALLPIALTWSFRETVPIPAFVTAIFASVHPWLIAFSNEARGYSLMLLLGTLATNLLPARQKRWPMLYALCMAGAIYTVSVAVVLLPAHAVWAYRNPDHRRSWLRGCFLTLFITTLLLLPMGTAIIAYYQHPLLAPDSYLDFLKQLPNFALSGDDALGWKGCVLCVAVLIAGSLAAWRIVPLRQPLLVMMSASLVSLLLPFVVHSAAQVRLFPWIAIWICLCITGLIMLPTNKRLRAASTTIAGLFAYLLLHHALTLPVNQPIRDGMMEANRVVPGDRAVLVAFLGADQSQAVYGSLIRNREVLSGPTLQTFLQSEHDVLQRTGHRPWVVASYEDLVRQYSPDFWDAFNSNYRLVKQFPGRISRVAIYAPRE